MSTFKTMKTETLVAITALTLSSITPLIAHAHGAGNGSDRLELSRKVSPDDVVIPVPGNMANYGTLQVVGVPGAGQNNEVYIVPCDSDAQGEPLLFGCAIDDAKEIDLNEPTKLGPGTYEVYYSNISIFVKVRPEEKTVVALKKLKVAKANRSVSFEVFSDLTDTSMQDTQLKNVWAYSVNSKAIQTVCQTPATKNISACNALASGDYHELRDRAVKFNKDGSMSVWALNYQRFQDGRRVYVTDPKAGQFVSVFPGVYGITFTDNETGKSETRYGIRVQ